MVYDALQKTCYQRNKVRLNPNSVGLVRVRRWMMFGNNQLKVAKCVETLNAESFAQRLLKHCGCADCIVVQVGRGLLDANEITDFEPTRLGRSHLTRIRRQIVVYFCLHRGKLPENTASRQDVLSWPPGKWPFRPEEFRPLLLTRVGR